MSSLYLRLFIFLLAILIPACESSSPAFPMMYSACKLNKPKQYTPLTYSFPDLEQSVVPYPVLTVAFWPTYRFLRRQVKWFGIPISFRIFYSLLWSTQSKTLAHSKSRCRCFSGILLLSWWSSWCWQLFIWFFCHF